MTTTARERDGWVIVGMAVAAASAATASFTGLRGLALVAGWPERLAWLLPITIDAYAMTSARVWLAKAGGRRARRFAQSNANGAITASIVGNAAYHMISVGLLSVSWPIVVLVGAVPAAVLGLTAHLHALRTVDRGEDEEAPTRGRTGDGRSTKARTEDELMAAARAADAKYRAEHDGRPITRDALRSALHIAGPKATELRRRLAAEKGNPDRKEAHTTA
jgi:hypothetical protein